MLREHAKRFSGARVSFYGFSVAAAYAGLLMIPGMRREGAIDQRDVMTLVGVGLVAMLGWPMILGRFGAYESHRRESMGRQVGRLFLGNATGVASLSAVAFLLAPPFSPLLPPILGAVLFLVHVCPQLVVSYLLHALRRSGRNSRNILVIGAGPRARGVMETIQAHPEWGYRIVGFADEGDSDFTPSVPAERICKFADIPHILRERQVDEVLVACPRSMIGALAPIVGECALIGVPLTLLTDLFGDQLPAPRVGSFADMGTLSFAPVHHNALGLLFKRVIDVAGSLAGLAVTVPVLAVAALAIRLTSPGPVFFRQTRVGRFGRRFAMLKLRTMVVDAEKKKADLMHLNEMDGPVFKIQNDPRITPVGRILRKWSIDELPQFWNVLCGDMSMVGPRPPTPDEVNQYRGSERRRLSMRPGLTCLWQVSGRNQVSFEDWMKMDLEYIDSWSLSNDLRILARTVPEVLLARGAS